ncbi:MAG: LacI family DNA-binding transcriptional regulator [Clostridiales bacterium]|nr:LacI family DNA-binding transcriptional regulator [Clostridiales bacterium]
MTISEIAKLAGVSSAAVSRYLNDGSLSQEKRERIQKIVEETNYQPSENARSMRTKKSRRVGVVVPQIDSESVPKILSGISQVMDRENYNVLLMNSNRSPEKEIQLLKSFEQSQVDGLILAASVITGQHREALKRMAFPVVLVGQHSREYSCVYHNDQGAACDMMRYLLESGCTHPAYLGVSRKDRAAGEKRFAGVQKALEEYGRRLEDIPHGEADFTMESGYRAMEELLKKGAPIDGVFCASDMIAVGAAACLKDHGVRIPGEVKITGIGHGVVADIVTPRLTTVHYEYQDSGRRAAEILLEMIQNPKIGRREQMLDYRLVIQETA